MTIGEESEVAAAPVQPRWELNGFALSPPQRTAWIQIHSREDGPGCHAIAALLTAREAVGIEQVAERLGQLVRTHEVFRTKYVHRRGLIEPLQSVREWDEDLVQVHRASWAAEDSPLRREQLWNRVLGMRIEAGVRAFVTELPGDELHIILAVAPLSADHRSLLRLLAHVVGNEVGYSGEALQYSDVAAWLFDMNGAAEAEGSRRFWREALSRGASSGRLSLDARGEWSVDDIRALRLAVPEELAVSVRQYAARLGMPEEHFYFAAWVFLLQAMSGNEQLPRIARIFDGLSDPMIEGTFGLLERQLPFAQPAGAIAADLPGLEQIAAACARMHDLQDFFPPRAACEESYAFQFLSVPEIRGTVEAIRCIHAPFRVRASVLSYGSAGSDARTALILEYPRSALSVEAAAAVGEQWLSLLSGMACGGDGKQFRMRLSDEYQRHILRLGSGESRSAGDPDNVVAWLEANCVDSDSGSVCSEEGTLPLFAVNERANRAAHYLRSIGIGVGDIVGLYMPRGLHYLVAMLAAAKCGAAYMPMDVDYPAERLKYMTEEAAPALIVGMTDTAVDVLAGSRVLAADALERLASDFPNTRPVVELRANDAAYVLYTSGSTGKPKGVVIPHGALFNHMRWMIERFHFDRSDVFLQRSYASFDASVWELWAPLLVGGRMIIARQEPTQDLPGLIALMSSSAVTVAQFVPGTLEVLIGYPEFCGLTSLRQVFVGGEALSSGLERKYFERVGAPLCNLYGPAEACIDASYQICSRDAAARIRIGKPIHNTDIVVVDAEAGLAGIGIAGEICISGAALFKGYLHRDDLTAQKVFVPAFSSARHYRTGDLGRILEDGTIEYLGRIDHQVKLHGHRIELGEIDRVMEQQPGVERAVTLLDANRLLATVVTIDTVEFSADVVLEGVRRQLPRYMVPSRIVPLESLPTLPNGKLDRVRLRKLIDEQSETAAFVAPSTQLQRTLADIWSRVLERDRIGITDRFFSIGGDSIRSIQVAYEASRVGLRFVVMDLFTYQTIEALSDHLQTVRQTVGEAPAAELPNPAPQSLRERFADCYPATPMQRYMVDAYAADSARRGVFHSQQSFTVTLPHFDLDALVNALVRVAQSPNFKTGFVLEGGELYQILLEERRPRVQVIDLTSLSHAQRSVMIHEAIQQDRLQPFEPFCATDPLIRMRLFLLSAAEFELFLSNHHAVQDGWGDVEFLNEVAEIYVKLIAGEAVPPAASGNVCKEFALSQHALGRDADQIEFWRREARSLAPATPQLSLDAGESRTVVRDLDTDLVKSLQAASERGNVTMKAMLLTAYVATLDRIGLGSTVGVVSNGRSQGLSDPLGTMGQFWNLMPFAAPQAAAAGWARCVAVQDKLFLLEPYSRFSLQTIEEWAGGGPCFQATFNFINFYYQTRIAGDGTASMNGTHAQDNFGFPLGMTLAVNKGMAITLFLQQNAPLPVSLDAVGDEMLRQIGALLDSQSEGR